MTAKPVPFLLRAFVAAAALLGVLAASYLAREQAASPAAPGSVPEVDVALFAVG